MKVLVDWKNAGPQKSNPTKLQTWSREGGAAVLRKGQCPGKGITRARNGFWCLHLPSWHLIRSCASSQAGVHEKTLRAVPRAEGSGVRPGWGQHEFQRISTGWSLDAPPGADLGRSCWPVQSQGLLCSPVTCSHTGPELRGIYGWFNALLSLSENS